MYQAGEGLFGEIYSQSIYRFFASNLTQDFSRMLELPPKIVDTFAYAVLLDGADIIYSYGGVLSMKYAAPEQILRLRQSARTTAETYKRDDMDSFSIVMK